MRPSRVRSAAPTSCQSLRYRRVIADVAAAMSSRSRSLSMEAFPGSFRQLLEAEPDQATRIRPVAGVACRRRNGGRGLRLTIAQIDKRRDGIGDRLGSALLLDRAGETDHR